MIGATRGDWSLCLVKDLLLEFQCYIRLVLVLGHNLVVAAASVHYYSFDIWYFDSTIRVSITAGSFHFC